MQIRQEKENVTKTYNSMKRYYSFYFDLEKDEKAEEIQSCSHLNKPVKLNQEKQKELMRKDKCGILPQIGRDSIRHISTDSEAVMVLCSALVKSNKANLKEI